MIPFLILIPIHVADPCFPMQSVFRPPVIADQYYLECRDKLPKQETPMIKAEPVKDPDAPLTHDEIEMQVWR